LNTDINDILFPYKTCVEKAILERIQSWNESTDLKKASEYAVLNGGKRFRPALVIMVAEALKKKHSVIEAAMAIEFFHTASLIADDLPSMDNDEYRRGQPTTHKVFGEATAILATYVLIAAGYDSIARNSRLVPNGNQIAVLAVENVAFNAGLKGAAGGQFLDIYPPNLTLDTLKEVIRKKTVSLFEIAFVQGWLFGGGDLEKLSFVKKGADHFGMAFQIADDFGDVDQDIVNQRQINMVTLVGREQAEEMFHVELESYRETMRSLKLDSPELMMLANLLENQVLINQNFA